MKKNILKTILTFGMLFTILTALAANCNFPTLTVSPSESGIQTLTIEDCPEYYY